MGYTADAIAGHLQEAGYRSEFWKLVNGNIIIDQEIDLGPLESVMNMSPELIRDSVEEWYRSNTRKL